MSIFKDLHSQNAKYVFGSVYQPKIFLKVCMEISGTPCITKQQLKLFYFIAGHMIFFRIILLQRICNDDSYKNYVVVKQIFQK